MTIPTTMKRGVNFQIVVFLVSNRTIVIINRGIIRYTRGWQWNAPGKSKCSNEILALVRPHPGHGSPVITRTTQVEPLINMPKTQNAATAKTGVRLLLIARLNRFHKIRILEKPVFFNPKFFPRFHLTGFAPDT